MSWLDMIAIKPLVKRLRTRLSRFASDESAASSLEYALVMIGIFLAIVSAIGFIGDEVQNMFDQTSSKFENFRKK